MTISMWPVMDASKRDIESSRRDIEKLIKRLDDKNTKAREGHLLKIESMLSEFYDAGILPKKKVYSMRQPNGCIPAAF